MENKEVKDVKKDEQQTQQAPAVKLEKDPITELTKVVKELAEAVGSINGIKEKQEKLEAELAAYREAAKKGFPIAGAGVEVGGEGDELAKIVAPYDLKRQGLRLMDKVHHPNYTIDEAKREELAKYFTLFLKAAYFHDPRALDKFKELYCKTGITALGDSGNEFPVPDIVESEILAFARETSVILQYARVWDMTSDKLSFPREDTGVSVAWGNTTVESDPTISEVELDAEELSAYAAVRNTLLADAKSDIVSWLTEVMAEAAGQELDNESFNGDGTSVCSGLLSAVCGYSVVMGSGSTAFSNLSADVLSEMIAKLDGRKKQGAMFFMNGEVLHYVRTLKDSNDRPIFIETVGAPLSGTIYGYPYREVIKMPSTSAANTAFVLFGNLRYFAVGRRLATTTLQVDPYGLWTTNRTRFKIYQRWALKVALPKGFVRLLTAAS